MKIASVHDSWVYYSKEYNTNFFNNPEIPFKNKRLKVRDGHKTGLKLATSARHTKLPPNWRAIERELEQLGSEEKVMHRLRGLSLRLRVGGRIRTHWAGRRPRGLGPRAGAAGADSTELRQAEARADGMSLL